MWFSSSMLLYSLILFAILLALAKLVLDRQGSRYAVLRGPRSNNLLFGKLREVLGVVGDVATVFDRWISEYGYVFKVPTGLGTNRIVISDPKAVAHVYNDSFGYLRSTFSTTFSKVLMGHNMISANKEEHRRLRRAVAPAFTNGTLRGSMCVFYDSTYKLKAAWDLLFESRDEVMIDVQQWMNKLTLDVIGITGFGHDFKSLDGHTSPVSDGFDAFLRDNSFRVLLFLNYLFPPALNLPFKRIKIFKRMKKAFSDIAKVLVEKSRQDEASSNAEKDKSILGLLLKGRSHNTNFETLHEEVTGQGLFLFAGYETTAISLSNKWALVDLARHPEKQDKLRRELLQFSGNDPTWDQVVTGTTYPYLDAVAHESLRLHPPFEALHRTADKDDVIPLSYPTETSSGKMVDFIFVPKGTVVTTPLVHMNRSEVFWGPEAKQFIPERWLKENPYPSKDFPGYRHLYTFSDGPRICIGRIFAVAEFKAVLSVLIRSYTFDLPSGPDSSIGIHKTFLIRPKLADEVGCVLRMRVRQVTG